MRARESLALVRCLVFYFFPFRLSGFLFFIPFLVTLFSFFTAPAWRSQHIGDYMERVNGGNGRFVLIFFTHHDGVSWGEDQFGDGVHQVFDRVWLRGKDKTRRDEDDWALLLFSFLSFSIGFLSALPPFFLSACLPARWRFPPSLSSFSLLLFSFRRSAASPLTQSFPLPTIFSPPSSSFSSPLFPHPPSHHPSSPHSLSCSSSLLSLSSPPSSAGNQRRGRGPQHTHSKGGGG